MIMLINLWYLRYLIKYLKGLHTGDHSTSRKCGDNSVDKTVLWPYTLTLHITTALHYAVAVHSSTGL